VAKPAGCSGCHDDGKSWQQPAAAFLRELALVMAMMHVLQPWNFLTLAEWLP
jgi:hypothetical protein